MKMSRMWGIKKKSSPKPFDFELLAMPVVGVEPTRVISTRDFESPSSAIPTHRLICNSKERYYYSGFCAQNQD